MSIKIQEHLENLQAELFKLRSLILKDQLEFFEFLQTRTEPDELHNLSQVSAWLRNELRVFDTLKKESLQKSDK